MQGRIDKPFELSAEFTPAGDQPQAIARLVDGIERQERYQTLLGVTGSGKTFTLANVIQTVQRPTLVLSHNKTLAAQLYGEFKSFFPDNAVEYFISYYDYYLPEAYIPQTDTFIDKDASINEEIEKLRLSATSSLMERQDVIIVASVSCIYGLGSPEDFDAMSVRAVVGEELDRNDLLRGLVELQYNRNDVAPSTGEFRVSGDTVDIFLAYQDDMVRIEFFGDEVDAITRRDPLTNHLNSELDSISVFPASHFVMPQQRIKQAEEAILEEMREQVRYFEQQNRLVEAQRIYQRTMYDLEMMREVGYCKGIENYSRHLAGRPLGSRPYTLIDYLPDDFLMVIDESHVTVPQVRGMYNADRSRKEVLVEHGFRLPSALDNRPLKFDEFESLLDCVIFSSATPGAYEQERTKPVKQVIRPTGLLDPAIEVRPLATQIDDLLAEARDCADNGERVLVTTLTKRTAEDLSTYLQELGVRVKYIHSDIGALERVEILRDLRHGNFDVLVGVNLLREGLDLPEVALVAILDADKEGFLRSETALIQTSGRAARNVGGRVILYADRETPSMQRAITTTQERRREQKRYNEEHGITPQTIKRGIMESMRIGYEEAEDAEMGVFEDADDYNVNEVLRQMEADMYEAAAELEFERAAMLRDQIAALKEGDIERVMHPTRRRKSRKRPRR